MKRAVLTKWRDPNGFITEDITKPIPGESEILIKVKASSVTAGDCEIRRLKLPLSLSFPMRIFAGWNKPERLKVLGQEFSGIVEEIGKDVTNFKVGDEVFGTTGILFGAYSEYICHAATPNDMQGVITFKPSNLNFEEACVLPTAGMEAQHYINKSSLSNGQNVLIIGAAGSIGTLFLQLAKSHGANVTVIDSGEKLEMLKSLGADRCVDYTKDNIYQSGLIFDLIIDVVGKNSVFKSLKLLKKGGNYYLAFAQLSHIFLGIFTRLFLGKRVSLEASAQSNEELEFIKKTVESGLLKPVIDRVFTLEQIGEAHIYGDKGIKKGNIIIKI